MSPHNSPRTFRRPICPANALQSLTPYTKDSCGFAPLCGANFPANPHMLNDAVMPSRLYHTSIRSAVKRMPRIQRHKSLYPGKTDLAFRRETVNTRADGGRLTGYIFSGIQRRVGFLPIRRPGEALSGRRRPGFPFGRRLFRNEKRYMPIPCRSGRSR